MNPVLLNWMAGNTFAWGIVGLRIFSHLATRDDMSPLMGWPVDERDLFDVKPENRDSVLEKVRASNRFAGELARERNRYECLKVGAPVIAALGNRYRPACGKVSGTLNIGRMVFEDTFLDHASQTASRYDHFICISNWNAELLRDDVHAPVITIHEGVDSSVFRPGPRSSLFGNDRFLIYAGGKVEFKKGQDLVLLAFKAFHARHPDSALVVAWQSPWPGRGAGFVGRLAIPVEADDMGKLRVEKWAADNGINPAAIIDLGLVPNQRMPAILREVDCALIPSRCEGGTSMVAMEAMSTGVPTVLAANTGLRDLISQSNCIPLLRQVPCAPAADEGREGWCESDVEEMVAALERLYTSASLRREIGAAGVAFLQKRTWEAHVEATQRCVFGNSAQVAPRKGTCEIASAGAT